MHNRTPEKKRKFVSAVGGKPGTARQVREAVAEAVRHPSPSGIHSTSNFGTRPVLQITPLDYEDFIQKNRIALESDTLVDINLFPKGDIIKSSTPHPRSSLVQNVHWEEATSLFSQQCLKTYDSNNIVIEFKFANYGRSYADLMKRCRSSSDLPNLDYEENLENDARSFINPTSSKEGYLFVHNITTENSNSIILKNSKKRYCCLCRDLDNSHKLDFYKDNPKVATSSLIGRRKSTIHNQPKLTLYLDLFLSISKVQIRNRQYIQITLLNDGTQEILIYLSSETDRILDEWLSCLKTLYASLNSKKSRHEDSSSIRSSEAGMTTDVENATISTPKAPDYKQFLTTSVKTTIMMGQNLITDNTFLLYPLSKVSYIVPCGRSVFYSDKAGICKERSSIQCLAEITSLNIRLPTVDALNLNIQIEPFCVSIFLFDVSLGARISETVYLDANSADFKEKMRLMCSRNDSQSSSDRSSLSSIATANSSSYLWGSSSKVLAIFNINRPSSDIYLIIRIDKVLHGSIQEGLEPYIKRDPKATIKLQKTLVSANSKLGRFRMPFAWTAKVLFEQFISGNESAKESLNLYKQEVDKLDDNELLKLLLQLKREKNSKLVIPEVALDVSIHVSAKTTPTRDKEYDVTTVETDKIQSCIPEVDLFNIPISDEISDIGLSDCIPFDRYCNKLYVYPQSLKFDSQKAFSKARNIYCTIEFKDSDNSPSAEGLKRIYNFDSSSMVTKFGTIVSHHVTNPQFYDQIKIELPSSLNEKHHILFTFYHVSLNIAMTGKNNKKNRVENCVGYAWLPLVKTGMVAFDDETCLPVAANLPVGYLDYKNFGLNKGNSGPGVKWLDSCRPLFKVRVHLKSTVMTKDQHLQEFFTSCHRLMNQNLAPDALTSQNVNESWGKAVLLSNGKHINATNIENFFQHLLSVRLDVLLYFLPTTLNQIFETLSIVKETTFAIDAITTLFTILERVTLMSEGVNILNEYVKYTFSSCSTANPLHPIIISCLNELLESTDNQSYLKQKEFLRHVGFFFEISLKDLCETLIESERMNESRIDRVNDDFSDNIESVVSMTLQLACSLSKRYQDDCAAAFRSVANFLKTPTALHNLFIENYLFKGILNVLDRGFVLKLVGLSVAMFDQYQSNTLDAWKLEFIGLICQQEYFVQLNLPILVDKNDKVFYSLESVLAFTNETDRAGYVRPWPITYSNLWQRLFSIGSNVFVQNYGIQRENQSLVSLSTKALEVAHEFRLSEEFRTKHYLIGLVLHILKENLYTSKKIRKCTVRLLRNVLAKHSFDDRLDGIRLSRICTLYFPLIPILIDSLTDMIDVEEITSETSSDTIREQKPDQFKRGTPLSDVLTTTSTHSVENRLPSTLSSSKQSSSVSSSSQQDVSHVSTRGSVSLNLSVAEPSTPLASTITDSTLKPLADETRDRQTLQVLPACKFDRDEICDLAICFLFMLKHTPESIFEYYWKHCTEVELCDFLKFLELTLSCFKYVGKRKILKSNSAERSVSITKARFSTAKPTILEKKSETEVILTSPTNSKDLYSITPFGVLQHAHLSQQAGILVLNSLTTFANLQKDYLTQNHRTSKDLLNRVFNIYLSLLNVYWSSNVVCHAIAALKLFVKTHWTIFFVDTPTFSTELCKKLLYCCNWTISKVQIEACSFLYLLMRFDFENSTQKDFGRIHQHIVIALSQLLGSGLNLNNTVFSRALAIINSFPNKDPQNASFTNEIKELIRRQRTILVATSQLSQHADDIDVLADLQYSLAENYERSPKLRETWLLNLSRHHKHNQFYAEAAQCILRVIFMTYIRLKRSDHLPTYCIDEVNVFPFAQNEFPNLETLIMDCNDNDEDFLLSNVNEYALCATKAERYESVNDIYKLIIPILEKRSDFESLANVYNALNTMCLRLASFSKSGRRLSDTYFRVVLFNQTFFESQHAQEYIYRENKAVTLTEMVEKFKKCYANKFGAANVGLLSSSSQVSQESLDPKIAYIQVTHVQPYTASNRGQFNGQSFISDFFYDVPFVAADMESKDGGRSASVVNQWRKRFILHTARPLPFILRRVVVKESRSVDLNPLENALEELKAKCKDLRRTCQAKPTDLKYLQLILQGAVLPTVNAGPLAYAEGFCQKEQVEKYGLAQWDVLKSIFRDFVSVCYDALELNEKLINNDQLAYHQSLVDHFKDFVQRLNLLFNENMIPGCLLGIEDQSSNVNQPEPETTDGQRCPTTILNYISGIS